MEDSLGAERDDEGRELEPGDQVAVEQAEERSDGQRHGEGSDEADVDSSAQLEHDRGVGGERGDGREGDVDTAGDDDEEDAQRVDHRDDGGTQEGEERRDREERGADRGHDDGQEDQDG